MNQKITLPDKQRKHRWVTQAVSKGDLVLRVWPSKDEIQKGSKQDRFLETIIKVGNDPRVDRVEKRDGDDTVIYYFFLKDDISA